MSLEDYKENEKVLCEHVGHLYPAKILFIDLEKANLPLVQWIYEQIAENQSNIDTGQQHIHEAIKQDSVELFINALMQGFKFERLKDQGKELLDFANECKNTRLANFLKFFITK